MEKIKDVNTWFEVWALGISDDLWDTEEFLGEFDNAEDAIKHAKKFKDISYIYDPEILDELSDDACMEIRVEEVSDADIFGECECIDMPYSQEITREKAVR